MDCVGDAWFKISEVLEKSTSQSNPFPVLAGVLGTVQGYVFLVLTGQAFPKHAAHPDLSEGDTIDPKLCRSPCRVGSVGSENRDLWTFGLEAMANKGLIWQPVDW